MSKLFHVSLDYLLGEEDTQKPENNPNEKGLYVSREMAEGFLSYQKRKVLKIGTAIGLLIASMSLSFWNNEIHMILFMIFIILGIILLFSVKLTDNPYRRLWTEPLFFDKTVKAELSSAYTDKKKFLYISNLFGIALIAVGFLLCPLIVPAELNLVDDIILSCGIILAGAGAFLCIYMSGLARAYRLLIMNKIGG